MPERLTTTAPCRRRRRKERSRTRTHHVRPQARLVLCQLTSHTLRTTTCERFTCEGARRSRSRASGRTAASARVKLTNCILMGHVVVGDKVNMTNSIVCENVEVREGASLKDVRRTCRSPQE